MFLESIGTVQVDLELCRKSYQLSNFGDMIIDLIAWSPSALQAPSQVKIWIHGITDNIMSV